MDLFEEHEADDGMVELVRENPYRIVVSLDQQFVNQEECDDPNREPQVASVTRHRSDNGMVEPHRNERREDGKEEPP